MWVNHHLQQNYKIVPPPWQKNVQSLILYILYVYTTINHCAYALFGSIHHITASDMNDSKCLLITAQMLQDKILCHQPSGTIQRLLCELIRQTGQSSFPPIISIWESIFMPACSRQRESGSGRRTGGGGGLKMYVLLVRGVYEVCKEVLSRVFSSLTAPVWLKNTTLPSEKREDDTTHIPVTIQTKDIRFYH